jgi:hypothetical protein
MKTVQYTRLYRNKMVGRWLDVKIWWLRRKQARLQERLGKV